MPKFVLQKDMKPLYRGVYERFPEGFPEFFVVDELPDDIKICKRTFPDGRYALFVCDSDDNTLISNLISEIENPKCSEVQIPMTYCSLSNKEVSQWLIYACYIADVLNIPLKQIMFAHKEESSGYSEEFITFISDDVSLPEMLMTIAHELRHAWQHVHHPEWFDDYVHPEDDEEAYLSQISEIDAEAFGMKVESMITGVNFVDSYAGLEMEPSYRSSIINQMNKIDVVLSKKKINEIRKLIEIDEVIKSLGEDF